MLEVVKANLLLKRDEDLKFENNGNDEIDDEVNGEDDPIIQTEVPEEYAGVR